MLRIVHTGRAYEVLDLTSSETYVGLRNRYTILKTRFWQQGAELEKTCREVGHLKALLFASEQVLRATKLELKSCQKSTLETYESQDPH